MPLLAQSMNSSSPMSRVAGVIGLLVFVGCAATDESPRKSSTGSPATKHEASAARTPRFPPVKAPDPLRGLYVNRWAAIGSRMWDLIEVAKTTEINALVIDVKDDRGIVLYRSSVPLANEVGADTIRPMSPRRIRAVLDTMRKYGIFPIARIVVAKDPLLAERHREWSIKKRSDQTPWLDKNGRPWLDPTHPDIWKYAGDLAAEAVALGFSEVQFDYVRFPDEDRLIREAVFPLMNGRVRAQVIRDQLGYLRSLVKPLGVPMTIDVFGLTATDTTDMGIGQQWEMFVDRADKVLPMDYPSHFAPGSYGIANPNAHPYETISRALKDAKRRSAGIPGAGGVVPWYQDFTLGPPRYTAVEVRTQIKAGYDNGIASWILWNPRSYYTLDALLKDDEQAPAGLRPPGDTAAKGGDVNSR
jgi:hypothetical protein